MAVSCLNIQPYFANPLSISRPNPLQLHTTTSITINRHFQIHIHPRVPKYHLSLIQSRSREFSARIMPRLGVGNCHREQPNLANTIRTLIWLFRSFAPGGNWWKLRDSMEVGDGKGKSDTVPSALWRIWLLVSGDRWIIIAAFASLTIAALSEILMPSLLAASMFAVKNAESVGTGALINLMMLSWPLAFSSLAVCFILAFIFVIYGGYQKEAAKFNQELEASANHVARDTFYLIRTVRVHGTEDEEVGRYEHWLNKLAFINLRESIAYGLWNLSFNALYRSTQIIAVVLGGVSISMGQITPEQLLKYILYCEWLIYATWRLVDNAASLYQSVGASETIFQMMDLLPSNQFSVKGVKLQQLYGHIELVDVSFFYPTRLQTPVLKHLNIAIQAGEVVAIVGLSGSGKSSLIKLLLRLYEPTDGEILIDGVPISKLDVRWLRDQMGYVGQEPALMHMDVKSNISYGFRGYIRHDDIVSAAKSAYAHDFISALPKGYDTLVSDNLLSGGQKQRVALARAILRNPKILILDEPTSALDAESEDNITVIHG